MIRQKELWDKVIEGDVKAIAEILYSQEMNATPKSQDAFHYNIINPKELEIIKNFSRNG